VPRSVFTTAELCPPMLIPRLVCSRERKAPCTLHGQRCMDSEHTLRGGVRRRSLPIQYPACSRKSQYPASSRKRADPIPRPIQYSACSRKRSRVLQEGALSNGSGQQVRPHMKFQRETCTVHVSTTGIENTHDRPFGNRPITGRPPCRYPRGKIRSQSPTHAPRLWWHLHGN